MRPSVTTSRTLLQSAAAVALLRSSRVSLMLHMAWASSFCWMLCTATSAATLTTGWQVGPLCNIWGQQQQLYSGCTSIFTAGACRACRRTASTSSLIDLR